MAAITATDWTVTVETERIASKEKITHCKLVLTSGGTYPSNGIPLPAVGKLGLRRNLSHIFISDPDHQNHLVRYDKDNVTFRLHKLSTASITSQDLVELATTATVGTSQLGTIYISAHGW